MNAYLVHCKEVEHFDLFLLLIIGAETDKKVTCESLSALGNEVHLATL